MSFSNSKIRSQELQKKKRKLLGHFKEVQFKANWIQIRNLNNELKPFNFSTKEIEGDKPTSAFVLVNYYQTIKYFKKKEATGA
ncbi:hypothetical protein VP01_1308g3 [Puccinia sorghi]|uniref:Uncharacterized protein n=1 Tax=Puccinia sorghi TaxID=27349 RepID=A0A0L6VPR1_9BASI|nr:hypothetical protein VP01_1308g3 [Puccinia sorghi]